MSVRHSHPCVRRVFVVLALITHGAAARAEPTGPMWLRAPRERGPLAGTFAFDGNPSWGLDAAIPLASAPRSRFALGVSVAGRGIDDRDDLRFAAVMDGRRNRMGAWLGAATAGTGAPGGRLHLGTGLWRSFAPIELEAGLLTSAVETRHLEAFVSQYGDSGAIRDTVTTHGVARSGLWTTAQGALRWRRGRFELGTVGGLTFGEGTSLHRWAQATVHLQTSRRLLVLAAYGQRPSASLAFDPTARPRTMVGVQLALWASPDWAMAGALSPKIRDWRSRVDANGRLVAWLRCKDAHAVELTGDFTDWAPVRMTADEGGWWSATLPVEPGIHQVQVRIDGGPWQVPPDLPRTTGEFAGEAGVLVVE